jgi:GLPGLI family protein
MDEMMHILLQQNHHMFKITTLALLTMIISQGNAQTSGTINYTSTRKLQINIQGDMPPPPGLPSEISLNTILYYTNEASLYQNAATSNDAMNIEQEAEDGGQIIMHMAPPENKIYCDLSTKTMTQQRDFMQRKFLIESPIDGSGWKLTGKQKMVLNYPCMEAVHVDSIDTVSAWYTPVIPISSGPMDHIGLPGMVLEVHINNDTEVIMATSVSKEVDASLIKKPKDGKKVTQEEFDKIVAEKMAEMGVQPGPGGRVMIHIEND